MGYYLAMHISGQFGVDVAATRADDLDKLLLANLQPYSAPRVLDIGCGSGGQAARMVQAGARVTAVDIGDYTRQFAQLQREQGWTPAALTFVQADAVAFVETYAGAGFDLACLQRMLHYLPYQAAGAFLTALKRLVRGELYVSVSGLESEIGRTYAANLSPVHERFCRLTAADAETFRIHEPICLYTAVEFAGLLQSAGWQIDKIWTSAFGNHKAVCRAAV